MHPDIKITDAALAHFSRMIEKAACFGLRLSLKKTGCSGYTYLIDRIMEAQVTDIRLSVPGGLAFFVDPKFIDWFRGMTIDFVEETKMGLKQKRVAYINPKEKARCGCGESFQMTERGKG